jgi:MFS transporter, DHA1 family, tetracycline resistance protein
LAAAPACFAAAISFANFMAALFLLPESRPAHARDTSRPGHLEVIRRSLDRPNLPMVLLVYFLVVTSFASFEATFALYSEHRFGFTPATIGYMFAWIGVVLATVQGVLVGRVVKRIGEKRLVPMAIGAIALALGLVPVAGTVPILGVVAGLLALGMGFNSPSMLSSISQLADVRDQGSTLGVSQSLGSLARIIGPLWGGWVFDQFGIVFPFFTSAGVMLLACALSVVAFSRVELGVRP